MQHYMASGSMDAPAALDRIVREQAFTVLNRLCALRMAEARGILIESVGSGHTSKGFQLYAHLAGTGLGETGDSYRCYLFSIFDEFIIKGNTPVFLTYDDLSNLYSYAGIYCGSGINRDPTAIEILTSVISRESKNINMEDSVEVEDSATVESGSSDSSALLSGDDEEADEGCGFVSLSKLESNCSKE